MLNIRDYVEKRIKNAEDINLILIEREKKANEEVENDPEIIKLNKICKYYGSRLRRLEDASENYKLRLAKLRFEFDYLKNTNTELR